MNENKQISVEVEHGQLVITCGNDVPHNANSRIVFELDDAKRLIGALSGIVVALEVGAPVPKLVV